MEPYIHPCLLLHHDSAKGRGFIAKNQIPSDTVVIEEPLHPLLTFVENPSVQVMLDTVKRMIDHTNRFDDFCKFSPSQLDNYCISKNMLTTLLLKHNVYYRHFKHNLDTVRLLYSKYMRNSFSIKRFNDTNKTGSTILFVGTFLNHSCCYNIKFHLDEARQVMVFTTTRPINAGE